MRDFALALTDDTSMIDNDVNAIFAFEQLISKVILFSCIHSLSEKTSYSAMFNSRKLILLSGTDNWSSKSESISAIALMQSNMIREELLDYRNNSGNF